jgi:hypothetical protein
LASSLLPPIPPETILGMVSSGHPVDFILRTMVRTLNSVYNITAPFERAPRQDPKFALEIKTLYRIVRAGNVARIEKREVQILISSPSDATWARPYRKTSSSQGRAGN